MGINAAQKFHLRKILKELATYKGRHTELVTVYVPEGYDIVKIIQQLQQEVGTATNIKSASTRKNVMDALEKMVQHLRLYKQTPNYGLAVFSGNISEREGQSDVRVWSIEPPVPLRTRLYRCDKTFILEPLQDMLDVKEVYGMVVMDRRDAIFALLKGKAIIPLLKTHSQVPGKFRAGGQSSQRFARLREEAAKEHIKKVAQYMTDQFLKNENLKGILVGGPGPTKYDLVEGNFITGDLKKKIIAIKDISYTEEFGLQELLERSEDVLSSEEVMSEKQIMQKFFNYLSTKETHVAYGEAHVKRALEAGAVETLLLSETLDDEKIEAFEKTAEQFGTEVALISTETREGAQLKDIGKIAAILRYAFEDSRA